jgi:hypothetical protein
MLLGILVCACGGGSDENNSQDPPPNVPQADRWDRFDVIQIEGEPLIPNVRAIMDGQGAIHIFYYNLSGSYDSWPRYHINHVVWDSQTAALVGEKEIVEARPPYPGDDDDGLSNTLIMDVGLTPDGSPIIAYQGGLIPVPTNGVPECNITYQADLMVNLFNGGSWDEYLGIYGDIRGKNPVFTDGYIGISGSFAVDGQGTVHMAAQCYYEMCDLHGLGYPDLMYVRQTISDLGNGYDIGREELVDDSNEFVSGGARSVSQMGYLCELILDARDNPIVVYVGTPNQDGQDEDRTGLRMARKVGGDWQTEIVQVLEEWQIESLSAAVAPDGTIGIAYYMKAGTDTSEPDHLKYAFRQLDGNGEWDFHIVDKTSHCGDYNSIAFDSNSRPMIAYYDIHANSGSYRTRHDLRFAHLESNGWIKETVASAGDIGKYNTIWIDADDTVYICTYEHNNQQIVIFKERQE